MAQLGAHTGLILLTGEYDSQVVAQLFETLSPFAIEILDVEQFIIRDRIFLTTLFQLNHVHAKAITSDVEALAKRLNFDVALDFRDYEDKQVRWKTVCLSEKNLTPAVINLVAAMIETSGAKLLGIRRKATDSLRTLEFQISVTKDLTELVADLAKEENLNLYIPAPLNSRSLIIFDVDSTLIKHEVIDLLGRFVGKEDEIAAITEEAMSGGIDFAESLKRRVALLATAPVSILDHTLEMIEFSDGVEKLIAKLQGDGHEVALVSGGFIEVVGPLAKRLNIKYFRANELEISEGHLTGNIKGEIIDKLGKAKALCDFAEHLGIEMAHTIAIGDGANDLEMLDLAGVGIAYRAKSLVREMAMISFKDMDAIAQYLGL